MVIYIDFICVNVSSSLRAIPITNSILNELKQQRNLQNIYTSQIKV